MMSFNGIHKLLQRNTNKKEDKYSYVQEYLDIFPEISEEEYVAVISCMTEESGIYENFRAITNRHHLLDRSYVNEDLVERILKESTSIEIKVPVCYDPDRKGWITTTGISTTAEKMSEAPWYWGLTKAEAAEIKKRSSEGGILL